MGNDIFRRSDLRALALFSCLVWFEACGGSSSTDNATTGAGGPLILQAFGGTPGEVAAQVSRVEPGLGQERTCASPLAAGTCELTSCQLGGIGSPARGDGKFRPDVRLRWRDDSASHL
jgi:hypothetical protein